MELNASVTMNKFHYPKLSPLFLLCLCAFAVYLAELEWVMVLLQHSSPPATLREVWSQLQKSGSWAGQIFFKSSTH